MKGILATGNTETKREIVPSGTHIARCYSMIHIGTVEWEYQGEKKYSNKIKFMRECFIIIICGKNLIFLIII